MQPPPKSYPAEQSYLDLAPDAILLVDAAGLIEYVNSQAVTLFGFDGDEQMIGLTVESLVPERLRRDHVGLRMSYVASAERRFMGDVEDRLVAMRADGSEFACEIALSPVRGTDDRPLVMAIVRDATSRELLMAMVQIRRHLLDEHGVGDSLAEICEMASRLTQAVQSFVLVSTGDRYEIIAATDSDADSHPYGVVFSSPLADAILDDGDTLVLEPGDPIGSEVPFDVAPGVLVGAPLVTRQGVEGVMVVAAVGDCDVAQVRRTIEALASEAALAIQLARSRRARRRLTVVEDRDRIARDLHDVVIQRLFASGMRLQSAAASGANLKGRAIETVGELDETIGVIRDTIFRLTSSEPELLDELSSVVSGYRTQAGQSVSIAVEGELEQVTETIAEQLLPSLNEMVSNAVRHSAADTIAVTVTINDCVTVEVSDDGIGFAPDAVRGFGLGNLTARALDLGGTATVNSKPDVGTTITWCVPIVSSTV